MDNKDATSIEERDRTCAPFCSVYRYGCNALRRAPAPAPAPVRVCLMCVFVYAAVWLKGKGDDFYRSGDFASAVSAYSAALDIDSTLVSCLSNRSACYMHLKAPEECVRDCEAALPLVPTDPKDAKSVQMRVKLLARQATALAQLGRYTDAVAAFQAAGSLETRDSTFAVAAGDVSRLAEGVSA